MDETVSGTLADQVRRHFLCLIYLIVSEINLLKVKRHPVIGKTVADIVGDVQNYLNESKVWNFSKKTTLIAVEVVKKAIDLARG